eukprot:CAMPEP_0175807714 /NCGR_PEP_ID=MMETSP0107_2-20121207/1868_1 /TAXON_ID=195067 ORGANISM="Goniomonas pacifica, Strain CCMP1869" /NCGR_SAMPLE_ID=MMETSP0107_2 /ASSEMBLY_ACC=CAM_ASM_000203 /LENGTH=75 /DNA_ID=CAMNT_0017119283 /DNA_START=284 /DNA_END=511 /DNA_ORIENTATION=-
MGDGQGACGHLLRSNPRQVEDSQAGGKRRLNSPAPHATGRATACHQQQDADRQEAAAEGTPDSEQGLLLLARQGG